MDRNPVCAWDRRGTEKVVAREAAATEERQWVRLTWRCNNRCLFCHDAERHTGALVDVGAVRSEIQKGRERGATRLILSGGEPTIHPQFLEFVRYGREVGYSWVQCVSNGRMFTYEGFVRAAKAAGLSEATLSLHGHTEELFDKLCGVRGAYAQAIRGLRNLMAAGIVVSVDVVVSRLNVRVLRDILLHYIDLGVREFDLLYLVPFGRAWNEHREELFFNPEEEREHIFAALELAKRPDLHIWTNRWPAPWLEGAEDLIQDPHKIEDEVRGGYENFARALRDGVGPECMGERCTYCFLGRFCRTLLETRDRVLAGTLEAIEGDTEAFLAVPAKVAALLARHERAAFRVRATSVEEAIEAVARLPRGRQADVELDVPGLGRLPKAVAGRVRRVVVRDEASLEAALALGGATLEVPAERGLLGLARNAAQRAGDRVVLALRGRDLLSETLRRDPDPRALGRLGRRLKMRGEKIPPCLGFLDAPPETRLDIGLLREEGLLDLLGFVKWYVREHYRVRSLRCGQCAEASSCQGIFVNFVRAYGFGFMEPLPGSSSP